MSCAWYKRNVAACLPARGLWQCCTSVLCREQHNNFGGQCAAVEACRGIILQASQEAVHGDGFDAVIEFAARARAVQYDRSQPLALVRVQATPNMRNLKAHSILSGIAGELSEEAWRCACSKVGDHSDCATLTVLWIVNTSVQERMHGARVLCDASLSHPIAAAQAFICASAASTTSSIVFGTAFMCCAPSSTYALDTCTDRRHLTTNCHPANRVPHPYTDAAVMLWVPALLRQRCSQRTNSKLSGVCPRGTLEKYPVSLGLTARSFCAGLPAHSSPAGTTARGCTTAPAATMAPFSTWQLRQLSCCHFCDLRQWGMPSCMTMLA